MTYSTTRRFARHAEDPFWKPAPTVAVERIESDRWSSGVAFDHTAPSGRRSRRTQFGASTPTFHVGNGVLANAGDWSVYELTADGEPDGEPTICTTPEAAIRVADAIALGDWR